MRDFRKIMAWEKGHALTLAVYRATRGFPGSELYGLTNQMRRSAASIPTNIAEGAGRGSDAELAQYMQIAMGSASELEYQLLLAHDLGYLGDEHYMTLNAQVVEVKRMTSRFIVALRKKPNR